MQSAGGLGDHYIDRRPFWQKVLLVGLLGAAAGYFGMSDDYGVGLFWLFGAFIVAIRLHGTADTPRQASIIGWLFGTAYFMAALRWIIEPFQVDPEAHAWMAPFAWLFLGAGLALFWMLAFWLAYRVRGTWRPVTLALALTLAEVLRGYIFTGFPWAMPAQALVGSGMDGLLAWVGPYGLTFALLSSCAAIAWGLMQRWSVYVVGLIPMLAMLGYGAWHATNLPRAALTEHSVRLVQPNVAQRDKWDSTKMRPAFDRLLQLVAQDASTQPDLIVLPETAIPWLLEHADEPLAMIADAAQGAPVALGVQRRPDKRIYNSMVVMDGQGQIAATYDKHHLVPFGEYIPFGDVLGRFGIQGLAQAEGGGYSAGEGPQVLDLGRIGKALPLICYEAVFPQDVSGAPERPDVLMQLTNDAWFGDYAGPQQHLAIARMRSVEQGVPLIRAANTGISAVIDPYGRITASLGLNQAGVVDAPLPSALPPTLYSRTGDVPFVIVMFISLALCLRRGRQLSV